MDATFFYRLILAAACGAVLGIEREVQRKPAGLRTNMLICLGAALFTYCSINLTQNTGDPSRIAAQIVTGIGFLGAGTIMHNRTNTVKGLTSAATVWVVAALGILIGSGHYRHGVSATLLSLVILTLIRRLEILFRPKGVRFNLHLLAADDDQILHDIRQAFRRCRIAPTAFEGSPAAGDKIDLRVRFQVRPARRRELLDQLALIPGIERIDHRTRRKPE
ncbi:MAG: MgtC/SapB family protein [bacterium]|nr:MgtC/SapB family protein [bacterium]